MSAAKEKISTLGAIMEQMISKILILTSYDHHIKEKRKNWKAKFGTVTYLLILHDTYCYDIVVLGQVLDRVVEPPRIRLDFWIRSVIHPFR